MGSEPRQDTGAASIPQADPSGDAPIRPWPHPPTPCSFRGRRAPPRPRPANSNWNSNANSMQLTRLEPRANGHRFRLYVDDEETSRVEIAADLLLRSGLARGDDVTEPRLTALAEEDEEYRAREAALSLLSHRARARVELRRRLQRKDFSEPAIDRVMAWLEERNYVDDRAFAEAFVRDRLRLRPRGRLGLIQELRRKGVSGTVAETVIEEVMESENVDERDLARQSADAWARKNRSALRKATASKDGRVGARRRLYGHLARRGFTGEAVRDAISSILDD